MFVNTALNCYHVKVSFCLCSESTESHIHIQLRLAEGIKVQWAPALSQQCERYLSSVIRNIRWAFTLFALPPFTRKGLLPLFPPLREQQIFLIFYLFIYFFPQPAFLVCQQVIKICLLLPQRSTPVETAAAEPRSWRPLLHSDELNMDKNHDNTM